MAAWCRRYDLDVGGVMPIATAWELGKHWYRDRLSPEWRPKTVETMRTILETVGLNGAFWSVP